MRWPSPHLNNIFTDHICVESTSTPAAAYSLKRLHIQSQPAAGCSKAALFTQVHQALISVLIQSEHLVSSVCVVMAKWEERDPRWLVEERHDGKNVNGWHWEEKNRFNWCKQRLGELMTALPTAETGNLRIVSVTDVVGEAMTHTRKGNKKSAIYDLKITMKWEAEADDDEQKYTGTLQVDDFASHSEPEEYLLTVTADTVGEIDKRELYKGVVESMRVSIVDALQQLVQEMLQL